MPGRGEVGILCLHYAEPTAMGHALSLLVGAFLFSKRRKGGNERGGVWGGGASTLCVGGPWGGAHHASGELWAQRLRLFMRGDRAVGKGQNGCIKLMLVGVCAREAW